MAKSEHCRAEVQADGAGRAAIRWSCPLRAWPTRVAVYCPEAALTGREVDVLLFVHGLIGGCPGPGNLPAGFITDAPFKLGQVVDASKRPVALVVPAIDWERPGGARAFGSGSEQARWLSLAKPATLNAFLTEVLVELERVRGIGPVMPRQVTLAGHSRAHGFLEPLAASAADPQLTQGALARLTRVWAFDTTYKGNAARWVNWVKRNPNLQVELFYRPGSKTAAVGDTFYDRRRQRLQVTRVSEGHCSVPAKRMAALLNAGG